MSSSHYPSYGAVKLLIKFNFLLIISSFVFLTACQPNKSETTNTAINQANPPPPPNPAKKLAQEPKVKLSPSHSFNFGRSSAMTSFLAKRWQIRQMNNIPIAETAILDFNAIKMGNVSLSLGEDCAPIRLRLDTTGIDKGKLYAKEIERELDDCSDSFEDRLMSTLADLEYLEKTGDNELMLISYRDKMVLTAVQ